MNILALRILKRKKDIIPYKLKLDYNNLIMFNLIKRQNTKLVSV